ADVAGDASDLPSTENGLPGASGLGPGQHRAVGRRGDMGAIAAEDTVADVVIVVREEVFGSDRLVAADAGPEPEVLRERVREREVQVAPLPREQRLQAVVVLVHAVPIDAQVSKLRQWPRSVRPDGVVVGDVVVQEIPAAVANVT